MAKPLVVIGGSIASLVAALTAARRGRAVMLYADPARFGGSFGGIKAGNRRFDLGSRLFELDYEDVKPRAIETFDPDTDTHRPFIREVSKFIEELIGDDLRPASPPELWIDGRRTTCPLMTADISALPQALAATDRDTILQQSLIAKHAPLQDNTTLEQASIAQHGRRLHELLIEPLCAKQYAAWPGVLASERRKLWAALFHPRTVAQAFCGGPMTFRPHRPFTTTRQHQTHLLVDHLRQAIRARANITVIPAGPLTALNTDAAGTLTLKLGPDLTVRTQLDNCAIGAPPDQVFRAANIALAPERITGSIQWVNVPDHAVIAPASTLLISDSDSPVLRISPAGPAGPRQHFAVEFGAARPDVAAAKQAMVKTGIIRDGTRVEPVHNITAPTLVAPTLANRTAFREAVARLGLGLQLLAGARRFGFDTLNDQIADGLHFGAIRC